MKKECDLKMKKKKQWMVPMIHKLEINKTKSGAPWTSENGKGHRYDPSY
ncbi:hypothetical protein [Sulfurovum riftiae]|nr:hypothetical protein [Sulfurovum riftiae]